MLKSKEFEKMIANAYGKRERLVLKLERCRSTLDKMEQLFELKYGISPDVCDKEMLRIADGVRKSDLAFWDYCAIESKIGEISALSRQISEIDTAIAALRASRSENEKTVNIDCDDDEDFELGR